MTRNCSNNVAEWHPDAPACEYGEHGEHDWTYLDKDLDYRYDLCCGCGCYKRTPRDGYLTEHPGAVVGYGKAQ